MSDAEALRLAFGALAPRKVDQLIERHGSSGSAVKAVVTGRTGVHGDARRMIAVSAHERSEQLAAGGFRFMDSSDTDFPDAIVHFEGSPRWLFARGELRGGPSIGIIGSRSCTAYGLELAGAYGRVAAANGWNVVSGLARGIDAAAHRGAASVGSQSQGSDGSQESDSGVGQCVAVLGCGIDVVYPRSNAALYEQVVESGGVILSEFPPGTRPDAWRFPTRNRIIAGLSDIVLVVEASEKGGALITARIAIDYGIPVYAVPGDVDRETSAGTNALIRDGAFPVFGPEDLATLLDLLWSIYSGRTVPAGRHPPLG